MIIISYSVVGFFTLLGIHHFVKARQGLRTGVVEGLLVGWWGKRYELAYDPEAFWLNVSARFVLAFLAAIIFFLAIFVTAIVVGDYFGLQSRWP